VLHVLNTILCLCDKKHEVDKYTHHWIGC